MKKLSATFHFQGSSTIGAGHAARCCSIARVLRERGWLCTMVTDSGSAEFVAPIIRGFDVVDPKQFFGDARHSSDVGIVDDYSQDWKWEKSLREKCGVVVVIDDLADRIHDCDILVDHNYGRLPCHYEGLVPSRCSLLVGHQFAIVDGAFYRRRELCIKRRQAVVTPRRLLINFGGGKCVENILHALEIVKDSNFKGVADVIMGFSPDGIDGVDKSARSLGINCEICVGGNMVEKIFNADIAIGAGGVSLWERLCMELPSATVCMVDNQRFSFNNLIDAGAIFNFEEFPSMVEEFANLRQSRVIVDGMGASRVVDKIVEMSENC